MKLKKEKDKRITNHIIENALKTEEVLTKLILIEVKILRIQIKDDIHKEEIRVINRTIKHIIYLLSVMDDRVQKYSDQLHFDDDE